jgi:hypothetical protein
MTRDLALATGAARRCAPGGKAFVAKSQHEAHAGEWYWAGPWVDHEYGFGWQPTQPEALAAALAHIRTHHQSEEKS